MKVRAATATACLLVLFLGVRGFAQRVTVEFRDAKGEVKSDDGNIETWTYKSLRLKIGRGEREISNDDIVSVKFVAAPESFLTVEKDWKEGSYLDAADGAAKGMTTKLKKSEEWAREYFLYWAYDSHRRVNRFAEAKKAGDALVAEYSSTHFLPEIELSEPELHFAMGRFIEAEAAYAEFLRRAETRGYARRFIIEAGLGRARCFLSTDRNEIAAQAIQEIKSKAGSGADRDLIAIAEADVLVASKKYPDAQKVYERVIGNTDHGMEPLIVARASNGLGDALYGQQMWSEAAYAYSRTFAVFRSVRGAENEVAWALFRFAEASQQCSTAATEEVEKTQWRGRCVLNRQRVAEEFEFTRGGQLARRELGLKPREPGQS